MCSLGDLGLWAVFTIYEDTVWRWPGLEKKGVATTLFWSSSLYKFLLPCRPRHFERRDVYLSVYGEWGLWVEPRGLGNISLLWLRICQEITADSQKETDTQSYTQNKLPLVLAAWHWNALWLERSPHLIFEFAVVVYILGSFVMLRLTHGDNQLALLWALYFLFCLALSLLIFHHRTMEQD